MMLKKIAFVGAELVNETEQDRFYILIKREILESQQRYKRFLTDNIHVTF